PAELRWDRLVDEWVIVAGHRQDRTFLPAASDCPLCPSRGGRHSEIPAAEYDVVVFENRFPSLPAAPGDGRPHGRCDVVVYSSDHSASFSGLSEERLRTIGAAWAQRTAELSAEPGVASVFVFENRGVDIGVTLHHPHGQIYAYPFVPPRLERMLETAQRFPNGCLGCALLADELADGRRVIAATEHAVAYVPEAARWPFEVHVVPRRHVPDLAAVGEAERDGLVTLEADALARLDRLFGVPAPYMAGWLQAPTGNGRDLVHLRLQIASPRRAADRLKYLAGSESLAGAWINDVRPEDAAERLRQAGA
ncbi:MAG TPA: galactose-1-phosphate uridylyltransferase, partial [Candidatus Limnocylindria bacterium]|nr:galactose-1-phosphate uridylyltransferase [Candidatus Limnocylindria bacterium]